MAAATGYYFNKNRVAVSIMGDDTEVYYLAPRNHTYIKVKMKTGYALPEGIISYPLPQWWNAGMWPQVKPWDPQPAPSP
jgi:hypothetical protein